MKSIGSRDAVDLADPMAKTVLNPLSAHIAILDQDGVIKNLRTKFGLKNKKTNLRYHLMSLS